MKKLILMAILLELPVAAALADDMPRFDVTAYCAKVAQSAGGSDMIRSGCLTQEQAAYDGIKVRWGEIPVKTQAYCVNVANTIGGSYMILDGCLTREQQSANEAENFKFKY